MEKYVFQSHMDWVLIPTTIICLITALKRSFSINNHINTWIHVAGKYLFEFTSYTLCYNLFSLLIFLKYTIQLHIFPAVQITFSTLGGGGWGRLTSSHAVNTSTYNKRTQNSRKIWSLSCFCLSHNTLPGIRYHYLDFLLMRPRMRMHREGQSRRPHPQSLGELGCGPRD